MKTFKVTQKEVTHTPTPWNRNIKANGKYPVIFAGRNTHVCTVSQMPTGEETEANIDFIVRAVNSHEALLEALKKAYKFVLESDNYNDGNEPANRLAQEIHSAIAQAEGK